MFKKCIQKGELTRGYKENLGDGTYVSQITVNISHMHTCAKTFQVANCKHIQLSVCQLHPNKVVNNCSHFYT